MGGVKRVLRGQWGLVEGTFTNATDEDQDVLAVVIPANSNGLQYSRRVTVPAMSVRSCQWPVLISDRQVKAFEFEYLLFENAEGSGPIKRTENEHVIRSFVSVNPERRSAQFVGYCGLLNSGREDPRDLQNVEQLATVLRYEIGQESLSRSISAANLDGYPESLECLEQLLVTSKTLHLFPDACDAVRVWTQRGGRTWICLDQTDMPTLQALLGDALPLTRIDETSSNSVTLNIHPDASRAQFPQRTVVREFPEPVRHVRVLADRGKTLWSIDGWPAVIELPFGNGSVIVTTVSPEVFFDLDEGGKTAVCAQEIKGALFISSSTVAAVGHDDLAIAAAASIGYEIPSRFFAGGVMLTFVGVLAIFCLRLLRHDSSQSLLWIVPLLSGVCAIPAVIVGSRSRTVAPPTAVQQLVTAMVPGQNTLAADGVASVFRPEPGVLDVTMTDFSLLVPEGSATDSQVQRLVWTDRGESRWENLRQPVGIRNYSVRSLQRTDQPGRVHVTLDEQGIVGRFEGSLPRQPADFILTGISAERMTVEMAGASTFRGSPDHVLAPSEFVTGTFLTDTQRRRAAVFRQLFQTRGAMRAYPERLTLMYWAESDQRPIHVGDKTTRRIGATLVTQEVTLLPPPIGTDVVIPSPLLPYRAVANAAGGYGGAFSNSSREWQATERPTTAWLEFDVPEVCEPFEALSGTLSIRFNAGGRHVKIMAGRRETPEVLQEFDSPAGLFTLDLQAQHLQTVARTGKLNVQLQIGDAIAAEADEIAAAQQDDTWKVERMMLTLRGMRTE